MLIDFNEISAEISHRGAKGSVRETEVIKEYLEKYLPGNIGVANGECISTDGQVSNECDIILFEKNTTPYLVHKEGYQIFPIECVYGVIEVKSKLDKQQLTDSLKKIVKIKSMPKLAYEKQKGPVVNSTTLYGKEWDYFPMIGMIFSFDSINLQTIKNYYIEELSRESIEKHIESIWVLNQGMIVHQNTDGTIVLSPDLNTKPVVLKADNPLMLLTVHLQALMSSGWLPRFRITEYLKGASFGKIEP